MPRKLAGQLVGLTAPREAQKILEDAIRETLEDFQRKVLASVATRMGGQAPKDDTP